MIAFLGTIMAFKREKQNKINRFEFISSLKIQLLILENCN